MSTDGYVNPDDRLYEQAKVEAARRDMLLSMIPQPGYNPVRRHKNMTGLSGRQFKRFRKWARSRTNASANLAQEQINELVDEWYRERGFAV